ncbi:MAG: hypothetical protein LBO70_01640 [Clostridiales Family XIII bacterium]|nr:hypothetical protein [Clostridiales Family XIII bacterium]
MALVTDDSKYATAFTEAVAATQRGFVVNVLNRAGLNGAGDGCILLMDAECAGEARPEGDRDDHHRTGKEDGYAREVLEIRGMDRIVVIDKYAGCARICAEVRSVSGAGRGAFVADKDILRASELISFAGIEGGAGTSSLALGLAGELAAYRGKKVLYLSFEAFESPFLGTGGRMTSCGDIQDFIFAFIRGSSNGCSAPASVIPYIASDDYGVMRFLPSCSLNRLRELNGEELERFLTVVTHDTAPDMVIVDWGSGFGSAAEEYIKLSEFTVLVTMHGGMKFLSGDEITLLTSAAEELGLDSLRTVLAVNRVPVDGVAYEHSFAPKVSGANEAGGDTYEHDLCARGERAGYVVICDDPYAFDKDAGRVSISLATAFGTGVKHLADIVLGSEEEIPDAKGYVSMLHECDSIPGAGMGEIL